MKLAYEILGEYLAKIRSKKNCFFLKKLRPIRPKTTWSSFEARFNETTFDVAKGVEEGWIGDEASEDYANDELVM